MNTPRQLEVDSRPVRIAYLIDTIESPTAGTESQLLRLILGLDRARFEPVLCCLRSSRWLEDEWRGCPVHYAGVRSFKHFSGWLAITRLAAWLRRTGVKVVQTHFRDSTIAGLLAARLAGVSVIVGTRRGRPLTSGRADKLLFQLLNRIPTVFVANSDFSRDLAVRVEGLRRDSVFVVPNILDPSLLTSNDSPDARRTALDRLGLAEGAPVIGIVANLNPWKRHDLLLRAVAILKARGAGVRLACVGGGDSSSLRGLAAELGVSGETFFVGRRGDVPSLLPAFSAGVLCSDFESSSNALLEYLVAGIPVVSTMVGGCAEVVEEGLNGYLVPPDDAQALANALEKVLAGGIDPARQAESRKALQGRHGLNSVINAHLRAYGLEG